MSKKNLEVFSRAFPDFVNELNQLDLDEVTPMQALVKMKKWQKEVLEMTKDEPLTEIFLNEKMKEGLRNSGFKVKPLKVKKSK